MKYFAYLALLPLTSAFVLQSSSSSHECAAAGALNAQADASRRAFVSSAAFLVTSASFVTNCSPVLAEDMVDDLAMPTEDEEKAKIVSDLTL